MVEFDHVQFVRSDYMHALVNYRVHYSGTTPAFVESSSISANVITGAETDVIVSLPMPIPRIVTADIPDLYAPIFLPNLTDDMDAIANGTAVINLEGFIRYRDIFSEEERQTRAVS